MPEHNSQQLLYAAVNTGQLALAEQQTQVAIDFPKQYGPSVMADGESVGGLIDCVTGASSRACRIACAVLLRKRHLHECAAAAVG
jgi:hypothetical protein